MTAKAAWDYAIGMIKVDGLEPTEDFKKYIELGKNGHCACRLFSSIPRSGAGLCLRHDIGQ